MKHILVFLALFVSMSQAQYIVKPGETLWDIAQRNTDPPSAWKEIYKKNSFLWARDRISIDEKGKAFVVVYTGEVLRNVDEGGIVKMPTAEESISFFKKLIVAAVALIIFLGVFTLGVLGTLPRKVPKC